MQQYFSGKRILITGAASGIGRDLAMVLREWGAKLALVDVRPVPPEVISTGSEVLAFEADVTDPRPFLRIRDELYSRWGAVDIVIAAAGVGGLNPGTNFSASMDHRVMSINYFGTVNTFQPFIESMMARRSGQLVGISSLAAFRGLPQAASYSASKAAQMTLLESLRLDLNPYNVAVTCVHPGFVATPMADHNDFQTPFKVSVRKSSHQILKAIVKKKKQHLYPWPMAMLSRLNRLLPNCVYDFLMPRINPPKATQPKLFAAPPPKQPE